MLNLKGILKLASGSGGKIQVNGIEALVEAQRGIPPSQGTAPAPVLIPPPPAAPSNPGRDVWIFKSFNPTVTANGKNIVTQGMCAQGLPGNAIWPGMVMPSILNTSMVTINNIPINVLGDMGTILPSGVPVTFSSSGQ
jgi:hypothetical protein